MSAGTICSRVVATVGPQETVRDAARRMAEHGVGTLVTLEHDRPGGIVTDRDIALRCVADGLDPDTTPVSQIATAPIEAVDESAPIEEALAKMASAGKRRLAVTGEQGRFVGLLALDDLLDRLVGEIDAIGTLLRKQQPTIRS